MFLCEIKESNGEKPRETIKLTLNIFYSSRIRHVLLI